MVRNVHIQGTRTYLYWALGLFLLGLYAVWDGWFPRESVLAKHPSLDDYFYVFNKVLAVISLAGSAIAGYIHFIVR